ncbi:MAG: hypothetical protein ACKOWF_06770 [Chloroflexota bacterium]
MSGQSSGGDDLGAAARRLRDEASRLGQDLDGEASRHIDGVTPELKQTMDDLSSAVSGLADKAKGLLGSIAGGVDGAARGAEQDALGAAADAAGGAGAASERLGRGAEAAADAARDAASRGSEWLEKKIGMSADELVERARAYGDDVADSVKEVVEGVQRSGEQPPRGGGTLN